MAVGEDADGPLAERFDGSSWSISRPPRSTDAPFLEGVSCAVPSACSAVGTTATVGDSRTAAAEQWNGATWSPEPSASVIPQEDVIITTSDVPFDSELNGVSCVAANACVAVGDIPDVAGRPGAYSLIERWNGTSWSARVTTGASTAIALYGVDCVPTVICTAVGHINNSLLAEHGNGNTWTRLSPPLPPGAQRAVFIAVACTAAISCTAVGSYMDSAGTTFPLAERWSSSGWSIQAVPSPA
jgi:hypothetical protein